MCRMVKGCLQLGLAPDLDWLCDMTPVDYVAESIVLLALNPVLPAGVEGISATGAKYKQPASAASTSSGLSTSVDVAGKARTPAAANAPALSSSMPSAAGANGSASVGSAYCYVFHLCSPKPLPWRDQVSWLRKARSYNLRLVSNRLLCSFYSQGVAGSLRHLAHDAAPRGAGAQSS